MKNSGYDDDYPTCAETFSTLRIFSDNVTPQDITNTLAVDPSNIFHKGDSNGTGKTKRKAHGWFLSTEGLVDSRDCRRHIDEILDRMDGRARSLRELRNRGCSADITSFWVSTGFAGGPVLEPCQMRRLSELDLALWWDIYSGGEEYET